VPTRSSFSAAERDLRSKLHALLNRASGFLHATPTELFRKCGKPNCQCASDDSKRHRSFTIAQTRKGKTTTTHIPKSMEEEVAGWIENFNTARELLEALSQQSRERIKQRKSAAKKSPKQKNPSSAAS
jgi:hypothetical protein